MDNLRNTLTVMLIIIHLKLISTLDEVEVGVVFRETKRYDPVKIKPMESRGFNKFNLFFLVKVP